MLIVYDSMTVDSSFLRIFPTAWLETPSFSANSESDALEFSINNFWVWWQLVANVQGRRIKLRVTILRMKRNEPAFAVRQARMTRVERIKTDHLFCFAE